MTECARGARPLSGRGSNPGNTGTLLTMFFLIVILLRPPLFRPSQLTRSSTPARPADRSRSSPLLEGAPVSPFFAAAHECTDARTRGKSAILCHLVPRSIRLSGRQSREPRHISPLSTFTQSFVVKFVRTLRSAPSGDRRPDRPRKMTSSQDNAVTVNPLPPKEMTTVTAFPA